MTKVQYDTDRIITHNGMCPSNLCSDCTYSPLCYTVLNKNNLGLTNALVLSWALRVREVNYDIELIIFEECL